MSQGILDTISNIEIAWLFAWMNFLTLKPSWNIDFFRLRDSNYSRMICRWNREKKNIYINMKSSRVLLKIRIWRERPFWFDGRNTIRIGNKGVLGTTHGVHECIRRFVIIFTASDAQPRVYDCTVDLTRFNQRSTPRK